MASYTDLLAPLEISGTTNFNFRTSPGELSCSLSNLGSEQVADLTDISVLCIISNDIEVNGYFEIGLAKWNSGTETIGLEKTAIQYDSLTGTFSPQGVVYPVPCVSTEHPLITCEI